MGGPAAGGGPTLPRSRPGGVIKCSDPPGRGPGRGGVVMGGPAPGRPDRPGRGPPGGGGHLKRTKFVMNSVKDAGGNSRYLNTYI